MVGRRRSGALVVRRGDGADEVERDTRILLRVGDTNPALSPGLVRFSGW